MFFKCMVGVWYLTDDVCVCVYTRVVICLFVHMCHLSIFVYK